VKVWGGWGHIVPWAIGVSSIGKGEEGSGWGRGLGRVWVSENRVLGQRE